MLGVLAAALDLALGEDEGEDHWPDVLQVVGDPLDPFGDLYVRQVRPRDRRPRDAGEVGEREVWQVREREVDVRERDSR